MGGMLFERGLESGADHRIDQRRTRDAEGVLRDGVEADIGLDFVKIDDVGLHLSLLPGEGWSSAARSDAGSGDAELSPTGAAQVDIAGSGDVTLTTKPASLGSNIDGSGDLHLPD